MVPLIVLIVSFVLFRSIGLVGFSYLDNWATSLEFALALMFLFTATAHWGKRRPDLINMVPPTLPYPHLLVTITGILEIIGAIGLLVPSTSNIASFCLAILLIMMFPANIRAAKEKITIAGRPTPSLIPRTIIQIIFLTAVILTAIY